MNVFAIFRRKREEVPTGTAPVARDRLKVLLTHERKHAAAPDLVSVLRQEILDVIAGHVDVDIDGELVKVRMHRRHGVSTLKIDVQMPVALNEAVAA